eukprot:tig00021105_g18258.t1
MSTITRRRRRGRRRGGSWRALLSRRNASRPKPSQSGSSSVQAVQDGKRSGERRSRARSSAGGSACLVPTAMLSHFRGLVRGGDGPIAFEPHQGWGRRADRKKKPGDAPAGRGGRGASGGRGGPPDDVDAGPPGPPPTQGGEPRPRPVSNTTA